MIIPTEIRPADVKKKPRKAPSAKVPKARKVKVPKPVLVHGLRIEVLDMLWAYRGELTTQVGMMHCELPNCGYATRCRHAGTGKVVCAECSRLINKGWESPGRWVPVKRTWKAAPKTRSHVRLIGGPQDYTNVRCGVKSGKSLFTWNNGFIIEGTMDELYVYDTADSAFHWWDRS